MAGKSTAGVQYRHSRGCLDHARCGHNCNPSDAPWQAWVYSKRDGKKITQRFGTHAAAKSWRTDALKAVKDKRLRAPSPKTLREASEELVTGAREGRILNRRKQPYKPGVLRLYESSLRLHVLPVLGDRRLTDITHGDLLELQETLRGDGCSEAIIRNALVPVQAVFRRAVRLGSVPVNPATDLELPTPEARKRAATPRQAAALLDAFGNLAPLWATAFYSGLRRGELQALRVRSVNLDAGLLSVERSWDQVAGEILPKSEAGTRQVFVCKTLRDYLTALIENRDPDEFVFGNDGGPFDTRVVAREADRAYKTADVAPGDRFTLHEARHSFSTFMDHAGISEARADRYMGHAAHGVAGRYRHLLPGQLAEDASQLDAYLAGAVAGKITELRAVG
jgi:integrase